MPPRPVYRPVARWLIFHVGEKVTRPQWVQMARRILAPVSPDIPIGAGTNAYFAELNRERPDLDGLDCVSYSLNPQVHAFDDASLVENLQAQADTVRSAKAFCGDLPIVVSPITLRPRFNPNATGKDAPTAINELPFEVDARQMSLMGAGWTLGSLKALCEAGVHSVTYYETTGWRGLMETEIGSPLPNKFPSAPGEVFPVYHALKDISGESFRAANHFQRSFARPDIGARAGKIVCCFVVRQPDATVAISEHRASIWTQRSPFVDVGCRESGTLSPSSRICPYGEGRADCKNSR